MEWGGGRSYICWKYSRSGGYRGLMECVGEIGATYVGGILGEEEIGGLMEWGGEEGEMWEVF